MGAASWPALTESTRASPKSPPSDSLKSLSDGLVPSSPEPLVSSPSEKSSPNPKSPNQIQNPMPPSRQKPLKVGERSSTVTPANVGAGPTLQIAPEHSPRASRSGGPTPQPRGGANHHRGFGGNRRGNAGGGSHSNHGNWHHRNGQVHRGGMKSYPRPMQPLSPPFAGPPPPFQPFVGNAMGFPEYFVMPQTPPSLESVRGMPFVSHPIPHAMFFPAMDPQSAMLLKQIDYYFSSENLCKDVYLRQNMDDEGWVPISLIAGFNKVKQLTNNIQYILDTVRLSTLVEVHDDKIRRRTDWKNWLLVPPSSSHGSPSGKSDDDVAKHLQNVTLEGNSTTHNTRGTTIHADNIFLTRSASGNLNNQFYPSSDGSGSDESGQFSGFTLSEKSASSRSLTRSDTL
ncbi:la-related protein 1C isoform X2 [Asparagus officinalis]|uniref:la-related protein 1C isoform X1 n=1 Tax=Asparagus officinalis TaxID=4686 RepID=UPI00098E3657|nr:la-related protein 1C isoform X1 [Asparagus officinalis]XP_020260724.1 la-related protein 1C isoform X2 [Asparagus officinalis]